MALENKNRYDMTAVISWNITTNLKVYYDGIYISCLYLL